MLHTRITDDFVPLGEHLFLRTRRLHGDRDESELKAALINAAAIPLIFTDAVNPLPCVNPIVRAARRAQKQIRLDSQITMAPKVAKTSKAATVAAKAKLRESYRQWNESREEAQRSAGECSKLNAAAAKQQAETIQARPKYA